MTNPSPTPAATATTSLPGSMPVPTRPTTATAAGLSPVEAARLAAEQRAQRAAQASVVQQAEQTTRLYASEFQWTEFQPSARDKLPFHRLLDAELLPKTSKSQAVTTLEMLLTICRNILEPPEPAQAARYKSLRTSTAQFQRHIDSVPGARDFLIAAGFRRSVDQHVEYLVFRPASSVKSLHELRCAVVVLETVVQRAREAEAREKRYRESEKEAQARRKQTALLGFEEDRRLKREKDDRDKLVRDAKAKAAADQAARDAAAQAQLDADAADPDQMPILQPGYRSHTTAAQTMQVQDPDHSQPDENDDDEDEEGPPAYGTIDRGYGRVLGTGQAVDPPPRSVRMVHAQDMEDEDDL